MSHPTILSAFVPAMHVVFDHGNAVMALSDLELFTLTNSECPPDGQVAYAVYQQFVAEHNLEANPVFTDAAQQTMQAIYQCIKLRRTKLKLAMLMSIQDAEPNWPRTKWLLDKHFATEKDTLKQANAQLKQQKATAEAKVKELLEAGKTKPTAPFAQPIVNAEPAPQMTEPQAIEPVEAPMTKEATIAQPRHGVVQSLAVEAEPEEVQTSVEVEVPAAEPIPLTREALQNKWRARFRPDWPWSIPGVTSLFVSVKQLRSIEAEIAAERESGAPSLYRTRIYNTTMPEHSEGYIFFRKAGTTYPEATEHHPHEEGSKKTQQIILRLQNQQEQGWVREDW